MKNTKKLVGIALFTAIVVVLQFLGTFIRFGPFAISLVLVPIVVGTALYDYKAGALFGLVFGITVLVSGDATMFLTINPIGTVITVLLKGTLAGLCAGLIYKVFSKKNKYLAVISSAIVCPIVNTGVFLAGCSVFFMDTIRQMAEGAGFGSNVGKFMIVGLVGLNFVFELAVNAILSPVILRLINLGKKSN